MSLNRHQSGLDFGTFFLLLLPPLFWAGNAVVGRLMVGIVPPVTLNLLRWALAFLILLPLAARVLRSTSPTWHYWRRFALLGLLGVGSYNALQYLALLTSSPINVTLVASVTPVVMLIMGRVFYRTPISRAASLGATLSIVGVVVVLVRGEWQRLLDIEFVVGDVFMLIASIVWAWYSWLLASPGENNEPVGMRADWSGFLLAQVVFGLGWSFVFAGAEWAAWPLLTGQEHGPALQWGWPLAAAVIYVALGPAILAYRAWSVAVVRVGPSLASIVVNLTPLFAALMSSVVLDERPQAYHVVGFVLLVAGIVVSSRSSQRHAPVSND